MNWFEGEIAQAVTTSKAKQAIFVVYVYGKDEKSSQITQLIDKPEVAKVLGSDNFVAIKIEAESVPYQQFSQIYKQVPVPSIYFVGKQGVPLEIVTEAHDVKSFQDKLNTILQKGGLSPIAAQTQDFIGNEQAAAAPKNTVESPKEQTVDSPSTSEPENVVCENDVCSIKKDDKPSTSQDAKSETQKPEEKQELTAEEKVERAKQLVEMKREEKRKEELEVERQKEMERRKMGQNVQQLKRWQDDQELKQILEEREREKRESQAARDRVLAQIAQDKAERAAKFSSTPSPQPPPAAAAAAPQVSPRPVNTNTARIQFRMPDGKTATHDFASSDTLETVHGYIRANLELPFSTYTLSTTFPRREFTDNERGQTLLDLELVPTAVILILPINRGAVTTRSEGGFTGLLWTLLSPIFAILGYLKTFVFGSAPAAKATDDRTKRPGDASEPRGQPKVRRGGETTVIRKQGNVHRLSNKNDSDDENNTWNGNSTQQM